MSYVESTEVFGAESSGTERRADVPAAFPRWLVWAVWAALAVPSYFIGMYALRYLFMGPEGVGALNSVYEMLNMTSFNDFVAEQLPKFKDHPTLLYFHAAGMGTALAIGAFQFVPAIRRRWFRVHQSIGVVYMAAALIGSLAGGIFAIVLPAEPGMAAVVAIVGVATTTFCFTAMGLLRLIQGDFSHHGEWMIRSFSQTLSGTTLRVMIIGMDYAGLPWHENYMIALWMCWVPNLVVAEIVIQYRRARRNGEPFFGPSPRALGTVQ
ncbi:DUF2306 domain-containing protein [Algiphilus aromaticivorans]|uniref:DUF2306 domain-containing protein n=1 Tax=Algiphilus aromaticivorans TaxID=382454 RepID=UPI0005C201B9|nr:DUF2306 domain-containing protein [Algiphilus aromaticivorans]